MSKTEPRVLGSLDLLPAECEDDVVWAMAQLNRRDRTQADILFELNDRLAVKGAGPISRSAFSRRSVRLNARARRLEERKYVYAGVAEKLTPEEVAKADLVLGEFLKSLIDDILDGDGLASKQAMELARAYKDTVTGQRHSLQLREQAEAQADARLKKAVDAVGAVVREKAGISQETLDEINRRLGIA